MDSWLQCIEMMAGSLREMTIVSVHRCSVWQASPLGDGCWFMFRTRRSTYV